MLYGARKWHKVEEGKGGGALFSVTANGELIAISQVTLCTRQFFSVGLLSPPEGICHPVWSSTVLFCAPRRCCWRYYCPISIYKKERLCTRYFQRGLYETLHDVTGGVTVNRYRLDRPWSSLRKINDVLSWCSQNAVVSAVISFSAENTINAIT